MGRSPAVRRDPCHTPGPMGLCGWLVAKMLRVPLLGTYHTDFPAYLEHYTRDYLQGRHARLYMSWLCGKWLARPPAQPRMYMPCAAWACRCRSCIQHSPASTTRSSIPQDATRACGRRSGVTQPLRVLDCGADARKICLCWQSRLDSFVPPWAGCRPHCRGGRTLHRGTSQGAPSLPAYVLGMQDDERWAP